MNRKLDLLTFGEILLRLSPTEDKRIIQSAFLEKQIGGAELNVAAGASNLGLSTGVISKIPCNMIGTYAKREIRKNGISAEYVMEDKRDDARMGLYYYEYGANPRKPQVIYDRKNSSIYHICEEEFPEEMYEAANCFHTSGITMGLDAAICKTVVSMIKKFKKNGALISFDVNFRSNLWSGEEARNCITQILPLVDIFFCSESTARLTFKKEGNLKEILKSFADEYGIQIVASTRRIVHSPKLHTFDSIIYEKKGNCYYEEKPYEKIDVIDRIGSGDAYISGFLYGLLKKDGDCQEALRYGNAAGAIKNTICGDMLLTGADEIEEIIKNHYNSETDFEMKR